MDIEPHSARCAADWVISSVLYFNWTSRRFERGDIEISDGIISAVLAPNTSKLKSGMRTPRMFCVPGLVNACVQTGVEQLSGCAEVDGGLQTVTYDEGNWRGNEEVASKALLVELREAALAGVTSVGILTSDVPGAAATAKVTGQRVAIKAIFTDRRLTPHGERNLQSIERIEANYWSTVQRLESATTTIAPAVGSELSASPSLLMRLHGIARARSQKLTIRLDGGKPYQDLFHEAYACSGVGLLKSLNILDNTVSVIKDCSLSKHDLRVLNLQSVSLIQDLKEIIGITNFLNSSALRSRPMNALAAAWNSRDLAILESILDGSRSVVDAPPGGWPNRHEVFDRITDTLTCHGAKALGLPSTGKIATGFHADLRFFDTSSCAHRTFTDSIPSISVMGSKRPRAVLAHGRWIVQDFQPVAPDGASQDAINPELSFESNEP